MLVDITAKAELGTVLGQNLPELHVLHPLDVAIGEDELQTLVRISRHAGEWQEEYFGECRFVRMVCKHGFGG